MEKKHTLKVLFQFLTSVIITFSLASIFHSQFVLSEMVSLGVSVDPATWVLTSFNDWLGLLPGYGAVISVGLLVGFTITRCVLVKWCGISEPKNCWWALAGGGSMLCILLLMHPILDITLIAGARTPFGFVMQCLSGVIGGIVYGLMRPVNGEAEE